ncbi:MAG: Uma2 family endonuclease [Chloroflexota bacterium]
MAIARQRMTLEQFLELPEEEPALEYWHGEVTQKVSPKGPHGRIQYTFGRRIDDVPELRLMFSIFTETRVTWAGVSTVPDLIVYRADRVPCDANGEILDDFVVPPDLAVEILSRGQSRTRTIERCRWYVENGTSLAVFADPRRRTVQLFRSGRETAELQGADALDLGDILPGFSLTVDDFFAPLSVNWRQ